MQMTGGYINKAVVIVQGLLLIPMYLAFIGDRMYGLWLASGGVLAWLAFMDMGIGNLLIQRISSAYGRQKYDQVVDYFVNGLIVYAVLDFFFCLSIFGLSFFISDWFGAKGKEALLLRTCFQLGGIAAGIEFFNNCLRGFAQALLRPLFPISCMIGFRVLGLVAIVFFLLKNWGLLSIPMGLLIMSVPVLILNGCYSVHLVRKIGEKLKISKNIIIDFFKLGPSLFASRVGNSMVKNIEPTLIAIILRPELVPVFVITRRGADMMMQFMSVINASVFSSFAHLYAEGNLGKSRQAAREIITLIFGVGLIGFGTYVATNKTFVYLWVGSENFIGQKITLLIALGLMVMFIKDFFSRFIIGTGDIVYPSLLTFFEAGVRVILMAVFLRVIGLAGLPLGMFISCLIFLWIFYKRFEGKISLSLFQGWNWLRPFILFITVFCTAFFAAQQTQDMKTWTQWGGYVLMAAAFLSVLNFLLSPSLRLLFVNYLKPFFKKSISENSGFDIEQSI
jgi:O-antigen/teichoic acid export membrane protein